MSERGNLKRQSQEDGTVGGSKSKQARHSEEEEEETLPPDDLVFGRPYTAAMSATPLVGQAGVSGKSYMLIEFDLDRKVKGAKVQSSQRICANYLKQKQPAYWHQNLIIKRNDSGVLSRLVQCAECGKIHEWSAADEGGVVNAGPLLTPCSQKCCINKARVSMCKCCPFFFYRHKQHYEQYADQHGKETYCCGQAEDEKHWSWRQLRECLPEGYQWKPLAGTASGPAARSAYIFTLPTVLALPVNHARSLVPPVLQFRLLDAGGVCRLVTESKGAEDCLEAPALACPVLGHCDVCTFARCRPCTLSKLCSFHRT